MYKQFCIIPLKLQPGLLEVQTANLGMHILWYLHFESRLC